MPGEDMYGVKNMNADTYNKKFKPWYDGVKSTGKADAFRWGAGSPPICILFIFHYYILSKIKNHFFS